MALTALSSSPLPNIAIITTDEVAMPEVERLLGPSFNISHITSDARVLPFLAERQPEAVLLDLDTAAENTNRGLELLALLHQENEDVVLVAMTRSHARALRQKAEAAGADEFFVSPIDFLQVKVVLERCLQRRREEVENRRMRKEALSKYSFCDLIGRSEAMRLVYESVLRVAESNSSVVIRGESGTGKELVAKAIVTCSPRREGPFIRVNAAAIPETLIEAELFGHEKGSFTGAHQARMGHFEAAHEGTLFLDEISSLDLGLQGKLLRVLEERCVQRIGGRASKKVDFRLLTATNDDLEELVQAGRFREDLYYRINVVPIFLPALREREGDIPLLVDHFIRLYCAANHFPLKRIEPEVLEVLEEYSWPGNIRELENLVQRLVLMAEGPLIKVKHLPQQILYNSANKQESLLIPEEGVSFDKEISRIEIAYLRAALRRTGGKKVAAAALLHIDPQKMKYLCRKYGIDSVKN